MNLNYELVNSAYINLQGLVCSIFFFQGRKGVDLCVHFTFCDFPFLTLPAICLAMYLQECE